MRGIVPGFFFSALDVEMPDPNPSEATENLISWRASWNCCSPGISNPGYPGVWGVKGCPGSTSSNGEGGWKTDPKHPCGQEHLGNELLEPWEEVKQHKIPGVFPNFPQNYSATPPSAAGTRGGTRGTHPSQNPGILPGKAPGIPSGMEIPPSWENRDRGEVQEFPELVCALLDLGEKLGFCVPGRAGGAIPVPWSCVSMECPWNAASATRGTSGQPMEPFIPQHSKIRDTERGKGGGGDCSRWALPWVLHGTGAAISRKHFG